jgi:predicted small metal-binding protein
VSLVATESQYKILERINPLQRKVIDCRDTPSESNCTLAISGEEEEVVRAAVEHAVSVHGHEDNPELRDMIRSGLKDEVPQHA